MEQESEEAASKTFLRFADVVCDVVVLFFLSARKTNREENEKLQATTRDLVLTGVPAD